jgi:hypothetical protein
MRRIVFLHSLAENDPEVQVRIAAFRQRPGLYGRSGEFGTGPHCRYQQPGHCSTRPCFGILP